MKIDLNRNPVHLGVALRGLYGLSQEEVGNLLNVHRNTMRLIDSGTCSQAQALAFLRVIEAGGPARRDRAALMLAMTSGRKVKISAIEFEIES